MRVLTFAMVSFFVMVTGAFAHGGGHGGSGAGSGTSHADTSSGSSSGDWNPFGRKPNETPEEVDAKLAETASEREDAVARKAPAAEIAKLDRKKSELDVRRMIAKLRAERDLARQGGLTEDVTDLEKRIDQAKTKLASVRRSGDRR